MSEEESTNPDSLAAQSNFKDIILNTKVPLKISNLQIPWKCFESTFEEWCQMFYENNQNDLTFDTGKQSYFDAPQWERFRGSIDLNIKEFYQQSKNQSLQDDWLYFGYKNLNKCPDKCVENVDFNFLGFPTIEDDITMWLGTVGAHTPCHYDTYGCNIVVQVYGKKSWLLFPNDVKLHRTRIPFEESSVYSMENLFSPSDIFKFENIKESAYHTILNPGDILIVPNKWWHYVENIEPSLNFNKWIPLTKDKESQLEECLVSIIINKFIQNSSIDIKRMILNPNQDLDEVNSTESMYYTTLEFLINNLKSNEEKKLKLHKYDSSYLLENDLNILKLKLIKNISSIKKLNEIEFINLINKNCKRYNESIKNNKLEMIDFNWNEFRLTVNLLNSICNPDTIEMIKKSYIEQNDINQKLM